jgi:hypothetical protein
MKKTKTILLGSLIVLAGFSYEAIGQLPEFYKSVDRVIWVVDDLDSVVQGWKKLGFPRIEKHGEVILKEVQFRGVETNQALLAATGRIGDVKIDWIEPLGRGNAFSEFLEDNGPGVFALVHHTPSDEFLEMERLRYEALGVDPLIAGTSIGPLDWGDYLLLDTRPRGKIVLGLVSNRDNLELPPVLGDPPFDQAIAQYAFAVQDPEPVSEFWESLGFPAFSIVPVEGREREYHGQPSEFEMNLGWQRHGTVAYEWCIPLEGPTVYQDHIDKHGEGFHHIGLRVADFDKTVREWKTLGVPVIQSGAWGEQDKPGSGRYAYMDTDPIGGIAVELLWSFPN